MSSGLWIIDQHTADLEFHYRVEEVLYSGTTEYQRVEIVRAPALGKALFLDGRIQSAQVDEFIYHEALVHVAMMTHPNPRRVLILGGGEGATLREVLRHPSVEEATMVDIDGQLVELCRQLLPEWHQGSFEAPQSRLYYQDARAFVESLPAAPTYDVVISDLTEPIEGGPSVLLFTVEFYQTLAQRMSPESIFVAQAGSADPVYPDFAASLRHTLCQVFSNVRVYWAFVYSFQLPWAFVIASNAYDPVTLSPVLLQQRLGERELHCRYYSPTLHPAMFALPPYLEEALSTRGRPIRDDHAFIWQA